MNRFFRFLGISIISALPLTASPYYDNSVHRYETDCMLDLYVGCSAAASQYKQGWWEDANTGKHIKIKMSKKKRMQKARKLLQYGCKSGDTYCCKKLKKEF